MEIKVDADLSGADIEADLRDLTSNLNRVGQSVAQQNKVKWNPVDRATSDELRTITRQFEEIKRIAPALRQRLKATGQETSSFGKVEFERMFLDPKQRQREMEKIFRRITTGTRFALPMAPPQPPLPPDRPKPGSPGATPPTGGREGGRGGGRPPPREPRDGPPPRPLREPPSFGKQMGMAALGAAGPAGQLASRSIGLNAGIGGFLGGFAAFGVAKAIGGVMNKVGEAQQESIGFDSMKRKLGDVSVSFEHLRERIRLVSDTYGMTYAEGQRVSMEFAKIADASPTDDLAGEVAQSTGFARSFGMDPGLAGNFFAEMRAQKQTGSKEDARALALLISEGIGKAHVFAKTEEVLVGLAGYVATQTRQSLVAANATGYVETISGLMATGTPGLTPEGSAAMLAKVNDAISRGGGAGDASQNFFYQALGKSGDLTPLQTLYLQEAGAFGTRDTVFHGDNAEPSIYRQWAAKNDVQRPGGGDETTLQTILGGLRQQYSGMNPELRVDAIRNTLGVTIGQAMALDTFEPERLGELQRAIGTDITKVDDTSIQALGRINAGDRTVLDDQARDLLGRRGDKALSTDETRQLQAVRESGDDEALRALLLKLTAERGQQQTEGQQTRDSVARVDNTLQRFADTLIPIANTMREALTVLAGDKSGGGVQATRDMARDMDRDDLERRFKAEQDALHEEGLAIEREFAAKRARAKPEERPALRAEQDQRWADLSRRGKESRDRYPAAQRELEEQFAREDRGAAQMGRALSAPTLPDAAPPPRFDVAGAAGLARFAAAASPLEESRPMVPFRDVPAVAHDGGQGSAPEDHRTAFIRQHLPLAEKVGEKLGVDPSIILGQAALETGYGQSVVPGSNNLFNLQRGSWKGPVVQATDKNAAGEKYPAEFRAYDSPEESFEDFARLVSGRRYKKAMGVGNNAERYATEIKNGGYAEDREYVPKLTSTINSVRQVMATTDVRTPRRESPEVISRRLPDWLLPPPGMMRAADAVPEHVKTAQQVGATAPVTPPEPPSVRDGRPVAQASLPPTEPQAANRAALAPTAESMPKPIIKVVPVIQQPTDGKPAPATSPEPPSVREGRPAPQAEATPATTASTERSARVPTAESMPMPKPKESESVVPRDVPPPPQSAVTGEPSRPELMQPSKSMPMPDIRVEVPAAPVTGDVRAPEQPPEPPSAREGRSDPQISMTPAQNMQQAERMRAPAVVMVSAAPKDAGLRPPAPAQRDVADKLDSLMVERGGRAMGNTPLPERETRGDRRDTTTTVRARVEIPPVTIQYPDGKTAGRTSSVSTSVDVPRSGL